eukprot:150430-Hanusia_phi.AAC.2
MTRLVTDRTVLSHQRQKQRVNTARHRPSDRLYYYDSRRSEVTAGPGPSGSGIAARPVPAQARNSTCPAPDNKAWRGDH